MVVMFLSCCDMMEVLERQECDRIQHLISSRREQNTETNQTSSSISDHEVIVDLHEEYSHTKVM